MPKKLISPIKPLPISLPEEIGNTTLNDLLNSKDTEFTKRGNKISFRRCTDFGIATLEIESYDTGRQTITQSTIPSKEKKSNYIDDIIEMKRSGMKQKDIAFRLGISESYVSQLIKEYNI